MKPNTIISKIVKYTLHFILQETAEHTGIWRSFTPPQSPQLLLSETDAAFANTPLIGISPLRLLYDKSSRVRNWRSARGVWVTPDKLLYGKD